LRFGVPHIHAGEIACENRRFVSARTRANFDEDVFVVVRVFGNQQRL
jgi:hypothetical protein